MTDAGKNVEDRDKVIGRIAIRLEQIENDKIELANDEKLIVKDCREADLTKAEIAALKRLAKLRATDKLDGEREKMAAMATVGSAMGISLFDWADNQHGDAR
jgi:hypothetical protein